MRHHRERSLRPRRRRSRRQRQRSRNSRRTRMDGGISGPRSIICCLSTEIETNLDRALTSPYQSRSSQRDDEVSKRGHRGDLKIRTHRIHTDGLRAVMSHRAAPTYLSGSSRHGLDRLRPGLGQLPIRKRITGITGFNTIPTQRRLSALRRNLPLPRDAWGPMHKMIPSDGRSPRTKPLSGPTSR